MPGLKPLDKGDACEIVEINGDNSKLIFKDFDIFSQGPFNTVILKSHADPTSSIHGGSLGAIVIRDGKEIKQEVINGYASFYFVVKGGKTTTFSGGRKSRRPNSKKNKRTRRKSLKKQQRRRK